MRNLCPARSSPFESARGEGALRRGTFMLTRGKQRRGSPLPSPAAALPPSPTSRPPRLSRRAGSRALLTGTVWERPAPDGQEGGLDQPTHSEPKKMDGGGEGWVLGLGNRSLLSAAGVLSALREALGGTPPGS